MTMNTLKNDIANTCRIQKKDLKEVLSLIKKKNSSSLNIKGHFYLVECSHDTIREDDFTDFLTNRIMQYCLNSNKLYSLKPENAVKLVREAVGKFVNSERAGEIGEIILFCLLESELKATQILNKMQLKTSANMHYHGADAIHFGIDGDLKCLYLGEAKMKSDFSKAVEESLKSINTLFENESQKKEFEVDLVNTHIDAEKFKGIKKEIIDALNPYKKKRDFAEVIAVFIGYSQKEFSAYESQKHKDGLMNFLSSEYTKEIDNLMSSIETKIKNDAKLANKNFVFFLIPFKDVNETKKKFIQKVKNV